MKKQKKSTAELSTAELALHRDMDLRVEVAGKMGPLLKVVTVNNRDVEVRLASGPPYVWIPKSVLLPSGRPGVVLLDERFVREARSKPAHRTVLGLRG